MMKKILIIEDDPVLREITAKFIQGENFEVFVAANGLEGVQQTLQHLPDLILCDISMPYMNGLDFYTTIKQIKATATIPLVFFSASIENEDIRAGMRLGADDYIIKPFDFNELLKVIQTRLVKHEKIVQFGDEKFQAAIKHLLWVCLSIKMIVFCITMKRLQLFLVTQVKPFQQLLLETLLKIMKLQK
jgi:DNA-binding response OmpR family regulator